MMFHCLIIFDNVLFLINTFLSLLFLQKTIYLFYILHLIIPISEAFAGLTNVCCFNYLFAHCAFSHDFMILKLLKLWLHICFSVEFSLRPGLKIHLCREALCCHQVPGNIANPWEHYTLNSSWFGGFQVILIL